MRLGFTRLGCLVAILLLLPAAHVPLEADEDPLTVQITSPLGRTGIPGTIRIVARVRTAEDQAVMLTRFYVDGVVELHGTEAVVYPIGLGPNIDPEVMGALAVASGGAAYFPQDVSTLAADYRRIVENLRRRYVISFTSTNSTRDGQWRDVEIRTRTPGTIVNGRGGYFAPDK